MESANNRHRIAWNLHNLIGQRFGRLVVVGRQPSQKRANGHSRARWMVRCDCGTVKSVIGQSLTRAKPKQGRWARTISCGCAKSERDPQTAIRSVCCFIRHGAIRRGISFNMSVADVARIIVRPCFFCGELPGQVYSANGHNFKHNGIDRLNSEFGYTVANSVPCCSICNQMKRQFPLNVFLDKIMRIHERMEEIRAIQR